ncbi:MarR family transcriptional regulator [Microbulbifer sp. OS29]|uniref:MarR family transcriptional regulator n=1 Tax=Microbulbifer okhotskensis TaxID=2926617 RepID=A0A9X2ET76_9GAMM|nr:MarR family transcriptional regulator [Microbulbifer okhotskensis]MCO1335286.1 MarR family transcriptional regulator [Microbulbifer okhotskensis]
MKDSAINESLQQLIRAYKRRLRAGIQDHQIGLPVSHIRVLKGVYNLPLSTARLIAQQMILDKAQVTRILNELVHTGLIEKTDNPDDRRSQFLTLTANGISTLEKVSGQEAEVARQMARNLSNEELENFARIASIMVANMTEHATPDERN